MRLHAHLPLVLAALLPLAATWLALGSLGLPSSTDEPAHGFPTSAPTLQILTERAQVTDPEARHSEFYVVMHPSEPRTLAMAVINSDDPNGGRTCAVHLSRDGGRTWSEITPPKWLHWGVVYDPWLAWTPNGDLHALCIDNGAPEGSPLVYARTSDLGASWTTLSIPRGGGDKSVLGHAADGSLYACSAKGDLLGISISRDNGDTWTTTDLSGMGNMCNGMFETSDGAMHALWESEESWAYDVPFGLLTSRDRGASWEKTSIATAHTHYGNDPACKAARDHVDPSEDPGFTIVFACGAATGLAREDMPSMTAPIVVVSPVTSTIVIAYHDLLPEQTYVLKLLRSTDMGASFHEIVPPDTAPCGPDCHLSRPVPGFDAQGRFGLQWRRGNSVTGHEILFTASLDEGDTWLEPVLLGTQDPTTSMFHPRSLAPNPARLANGAIEFATDPEADPIQYVGQSLFLSAVDGVNGDGAHYWSMGATDEGFVSMWLDGTGNGTPQVWARIVALR